MTLAGRVVVITGASGGIGAATAVHLAHAGAQVGLVARRREALEAVAAQCGGLAAVFPADVTDRAAVDGVMAAALERFGHVDVWVNNAGQGISRRVSELTDDDLDAMVRVNVKSALYGMQAVLPHFRARGTGQIVNVSSLLGRMPYVPIRAAYSAAKHMLNVLTANLRDELRTTHPGIRVTLVSPGVVWTDFGLNAVGGGPDSRSFPDGQTPEEVAAVIAGVIAEPQDDVYTRGDYRGKVGAYLAAL
ncbi:MAG: SDR family NAD(P)-dependent oxidoreductase [Gemmatimonadales bacterium]|nr:SDR family NAD(P)-dependent oxidoreductase [Gemmatimonadales bacterium]